MNFNIMEAPFPKADDLAFEIVERKGIGHPDTLCDAIAERASRYYSKYFLDKYSRLAHHWFDKVMLLGGQSIIEYGRGEIVHPYTVIYAGKAVTKVGSEDVPMNEILTKAASDVLTEVLDGFQPGKDLVIDVKLSNYIGPGQKKTRYNPDSPQELFDPKSKERVSNDCNVCSGYAPLSRLETIVRDVEKYLTSESYRGYYRDTGFDVKIVGIRDGGKISLFVNIPFLANKIHSRDSYLSRVASVTADIRQFLEPYSDMEIDLNVNPEKDSGRSYMTATGSVADTGDVGVVGRGNRLNGLITPMRPMSIEASSGKNPIDHTGKLYGLASQAIADEIWKETGVENQVHLVTFKEYPVTKPQSVLVYLHNPIDKENINKIEAISRNILEGIPGMTDKMIVNGYVMW